MSGESFYTNGTRIHIGGLNPNTSEDDIHKFCVEFGAVNEITIKNGITNSFCFVEYDDIRDAHDAVPGLSGKELAGAKVTVGFARIDNIEGAGGRVGGRGGWRDDRDHGGGRGRFGDETGGRGSRYGDDRSGGGRGCYGDDRDSGIRGRYIDRSDGNRWGSDRDQGSFFGRGGSYNRGGNRGSAGFGGDRDSSSYYGRGSNRRP